MSEPQPAAMAGLALATAEHLEAHAAVIVQTKHKDIAAERDGLNAIAGHLRAASKELSAASEGMKAAAAWPNVPHDVAKLRADAANTAGREHKMKALAAVAAEVQKEIDFWKKVPGAATAK